LVRVTARVRARVRVNVGVRVEIRIKVRVKARGDLFERTTLGERNGPIGCHIAVSVLI
jgi:hypothetical protein